MFISIDEEKAFSEIWHGFLIKDLEKGLETAYLRVAKTMSEKPTASSIRNREKLEAAQLKSGRRQDCPLSPPLFNTLLSARKGKDTSRKKGVK